MKTITITDNATPELLDFIRTMTARRPLHAALGSRLSDELQDHFLARNVEPNKKGWPKQNFWADIRDATALDAVTDEDATVKVADERMNQKYHGGTLTPKRGKALAIPLTARAYAAGSPREGEWGDDLFFVDRSADGKAPLLATADDGNLRPQYILVRSVTQDPDPRALPERQSLQDALDEEFADYMDRHFPQ